MHQGGYGPEPCLSSACTLQTNPRGRLIPTPQWGVGYSGCFISLRAQTALITETFETEWYKEISTHMTLVDEQVNRIADETKMIQASVPGIGIITR